ncbi:MAG: hypothetical protein HY908_19780 [Myxococcales bacterium]|nr:hypothetical protein [Myxococcales bacterium]
MQRLRFAVGVSLGGMVLAASAFVACESETSVFNGGTTSTTTTTSTATGGAGGAGTGGASQGGQAQGGQAQGGQAQGGASQGGAGGASACAPMGDACSGCLYTSCNATYCACSTSPDCMSVSTCALACNPGDTACVEACFAADANGMAEFMLGADCAYTSCSNLCPGTLPIDPCQLCLAENCETQLEACFGNPACVALVDCAQACPPGPQQQNCITQCGLANLGGIQQGQALQGCMSGSCGNSCP